MSPEVLGWTIVAIAAFTFFGAVAVIGEKADDSAWAGYAVAILVFLPVAGWGFALAFGSAAEGGAAALGSLLLIIPMLIGYSSRE
jgi:hypothetical protein